MTRNSSKTKSERKPVRRPRGRPKVFTGEVETINLRIESDLISEIDQQVLAGNFGGRSELIREAIRALLADEKSGVTLKIAAPSIPVPTDEVLEIWDPEMTHREHSELLRTYAIENNRKRITTADHITILRTYNANKKRPR